MAVDDDSSISALSAAAPAAAPAAAAEVDAGAAEKDAASAHRRSSLMIQFRGSWYHLGHFVSVFGTQGQVKPSTRQERFFSAYAAALKLLPGNVEKLLKECTKGKIRDLDVVVFWKENEVVKTNGVRTLPPGDYAVVAVLGLFEKSKKKNGYGFYRVELNTPGLTAKRSKKEEKAKLEGAFQTVQLVYDADQKGYVLPDGVEEYDATSRTFKPLVTFSVFSEPAFVSETGQRWKVGSDPIVLPDVLVDTMDESRDQMLEEEQRRFRALEDDREAKAAAAAAERSTKGPAHMQKGELEKEATKTLGAKLFGGSLDAYKAVVETIRAGTEVEVAVETGTVLPDGLVVLGLARTFSADKSPLAGGFLVTQQQGASQPLLASDGVAASGAVLLRVRCEDGTEVSVARLHNRHEYPTERALRAKLTKLRAKVRGARVSGLRLVVGWWGGGVVEWWDGGVVGWWAGGLVGWWAGGLVGWWDGGMVGW